ncbi:hypothetical protein CEXT_531901 [Caerostris extrusa]|uniref:Endonuclease/exonuclease/phosphatase domain-containing protein n=1 Tax=Caerostris extrusa TaxID=172846 RepID=A0AAV4T097_CAEEX|nr:hypothetical protein CEXT_531901 [Caerostris extrusa]
MPVARINLQHPTSANNIRPSTSVTETPKLITSPLENNQSTSNTPSSNNQDILEFIYEYSPHIIAIQETHLRPSDKINLRNYTTYRSDRLTHQGGGTAISSSQNATGRSQNSAYLKRCAEDDDDGDDGNDEDPETRTIERDTQDYNHSRSSTVIFKRVAFRDANSDECDEMDSDSGTDYTSKKEEKMIC